MNTEIKEPIEYRLYIMKIINKYYQTDAIQKDMLQEGYIAIIQAKKTYNPNKGISFISYATYYIKNRIELYLNRYTHIVRRPSSIIRNESDETIKQVISISTPIDDNGFTIQDLLASDEPTTIEDNSYLISAINRLKKDSDKDVIKMYYGIAPYAEESTHLEIATKYNCTAENIRLKIKRILNVLKNDSRLKKNRETN